jgi:hypothetical protein
MHGLFNPFSRGLVLAFKLGRVGGVKRFTALGMTLSLFPSTRHHSMAYWEQQQNNHPVLRFTSNKVVRVRAEKAYREMEIQLHSFLTF